jgi:hypothetical protein
VGCGPGILTVSLAHLFEEAVGLEPDAAMLAEARRAADEAGITYVVWVNAVAEALRTAAAGGRTTRTGAGCGWSDTSRTERRSTNMEPLAVLRRHTR